MTTMRDLTIGELKSVAGGDGMGGAGAGVGAVGAGMGRIGFGGGSCSTVQVTNCILVKGVKFCEAPHPETVCD